MDADYRFYPEGFAGLGDDIEVELHIVSADEVDDLLAGGVREPQYDGSLFSYLKSVDENPGFHDAFGDDVTPEALYAKLSGGEAFLFGGGAQPVFVLRRAEPAPAPAP